MSAHFITSSRLYQQESYWISIRLVFLHKTYINQFVASATEFISHDDHQARNGWKCQFRLRALHTLVASHDRPNSYHNGRFVQQPLRPRPCPYVGSEHPQLHLTEHFERARTPRPAMPLVPNKTKSPGHQERQCLCKVRPFHKKRLPIRL